MARLWMLAPVALVLAASGCFGGAAGPAPSAAEHSQASGLVARPYAVLHVRGTYASGVRARFTLTCRPLGFYERFAGLLSWRARLCAAILDHWARYRPEGVACWCPLSATAIDVRGTIRGRPVHERFTSCVCGDGPRAAADVRVILRTHPPARAGGVR